MYKLRHAVREDKDKLYDIKRTSVRKYVEPIWGWDETYQRKEFEASFSNIQGIVANDEIIGYIELEGFNVNEIHLVPEYQGKGIGRDILVHFMLDALSKGEKITLGCFKENIGALRFYKSLGFEIDDITETHHILSFCANTTCETHHDVSVIHGDVCLLPLVKSMWLKLNKHHLDSSEHFKDHFSNNVYENRIKGLHHCESVRVSVLKKERTLGYVINSVKIDGTGEIDSLYLEDDSRGLGLGDFLMTSSLRWLESSGADPIKLGIAAGNESVFEFYEKYGFYKKVHILQRK